MNTRVQVEHCVTEETTGVDIVREQVLVAAGEKLSFAQEDIRLHGHAIECRINAEDASKNFAPAPGTVAHYREPSGPGVRVDSGVVSGTEITPLYDPMVAKLIVWDADRERATRRMLRALEEYEVEGVKTLIPFHKAIMASEQWAKGETCRDLIEDKDWLKALAFEAAPAGGDDDAGARGAHLHRRGLGQALRRRRARRGARRRRAPAPAQRRGPQRPQARAQERRRRRRGRRHARLAAAGQRLEGARRAGRRGRGGRARLHHRGDEDGERDLRPQGRARSPSWPSRRAAR